MSDAIRTGAGQAGNLLLDIANAFVGIHKEYYGRGPTKARAHVTRELVVVLLEGGFSRAEQTLTEHGRDDVVDQSRGAMQETIEDVSIEIVERLTGRRVRSFMSANDSANEMQAEIFVLEGEPAQSASDLAARAQAACEENVEVRQDLRALRSEQAQARDTLHKKRTREV